MFGPTLKRGRLPAAVLLAALTVTLTACAGGQADKADPVGSTTATLNGYWKSTVSNPALVRVYFNYGTTTAHGDHAYGPSPDGQCVPVQGGGTSYWAGCFYAGPANTVHKYSVPVTGLAPNTTYHFSLCANDGTTISDICVNDKTFKTAP